MFEAKMENDFFNKIINDFLASEICNSAIRVTFSEYLMKINSIQIVSRNFFSIENNSCCFNLN